MIASAAFTVGSSMASNDAGLSASSSLPRSTSTSSSDMVLPNASRRRFRWLSKSGVGNAKSEPTHPKYSRARPRPVDAAANPLAQEHLNNARADAAMRFQWLAPTFPTFPPVCSIRAYSICAPEAFMMGAHFASSALMNSAVLAGVMPGVGSIPASCRRWRTAGSASALVMAALSSSIIG